MIDRILSSHRPKIALVIGTYASAPYVHLQLECVKRFNPGVSVLVHDDCSGDRRLNGIAARYGASFQSTGFRNGHDAGDVAAFVKGFKFAKDNKCDVLVKFSRRFVPKIGWTKDLSRTMFLTQFATYSNGTQGVLGFTTECIAFHVESWFKAGAVDKLERILEGWNRTKKCDLVEAVIHDRAREVHAATENEIRRLHCVYIPSPDGFWWWSLIGAARNRPDPDVMWYERSSQKDYSDFAKSLGLGYSPEDFSVVR